MRWKDFIRKCMVRIIPLFITISVYSIVMYSMVVLRLWNPKTMVQSLQKSEYYAESYDDLIDNISKIVEKTEIPVSEIQQVISLKQYYLTTSTNILELQKTQDAYKDIDLKAELTGLMNDYIADHGITLNNRTQTVEQLAESIQKVFNQAAQPEFPKQINHMKSQYKKDMTHIFWIMGTIFVLSVALLIVVRRHRFKYLQDTACGLYGVSVAGLITVIALVRNITIFDTEAVYYNLFLHQMIKAASQYLVCMIVLTAIAGTGLMIARKLCTNTSR